MFQNLYVLLKKDIELGDVSPNFCKKIEMPALGFEVFPLEYIRLPFLTSVDCIAMQCYYVSRQ